MVGGTSSNGVVLTSLVVGVYWISSNTGVRSTTAPGVTARSSPTENSSLATMLGTRGATAMSPTRFRRPRTMLAPPVLTTSLSAAGFSHGRFEGAAAS